MNISGAVSAVVEDMRRRRRVKRRWRMLNILVGLDYIFRFWYSILYCHNVHEKKISSPGHQSILFY
jgi:hypothetical protein